MAVDTNLAELLKTQKSLTEWLQDINHNDADLLRHEDNEKRERLKVLNQVINIPFDEPVQFEATDLNDNNNDFKKYFDSNKNELCALRLIPKKPGLAKLRMRGETVDYAYKWFKEQSIEPQDYRADFIPHPHDYSWATIFIVNQHGIQGEIIFGWHHQLTQGFHQTSKPSIFRYDFKKWMIYPENAEALKYLKDLINFLNVPDPNQQNELIQKLNATFSNNYLEGYFETTDSSLGTWFIDYSPTLGKLYNDMIIKAPEPNHSSQLNGQTGSNGVATGPVKIVRPEQLNEPFEKYSILVCEVTTPDYVPLMQKAAGIITDQGGILSHAAIVARELKVPCIVGTNEATAVLKDGQIVTVDANKGVISY